VSTQELDVKKAWRAIRRQRWVVAAVAAVGMLGGLAFALANPPMHTATSLVVLPPPANNAENAPGTQSIDTQVFIANSEPVLKSAGQNLTPPLAPKLIRERVDVKAVTQDVIEIKARGTSAQQAMTLANAVAEVYLVFVTTEQKLPGDLGKKTGARMLEEATTARGGNLLAHLGLFGLLGALTGALAGSVAILAAARGDRRLRLRDEIADAVGIPVLASVSSYRAKDVSDWADLLERYTPTAVDAWSLRRTLHRLGLDVKGGPPVSLAVISFAEDDKALPLGPQLAAFATSIGIPTALVVDTHHESTNALPEGDPAPAVSQEDARHRLLGDGAQFGDPPSEVALDIQLIVVDRDAPQLAGALHTTATVVGLSAGAVTAEELARLAVAAAADDRAIDGLVVADPDPSDRTTGRVPASMRRSSSRLPTLLTGAARRTTR
jgi:capsular polysaccharide biosynthesis protein